MGELAEFNPKSNLPDKFEYVDLESVVGTELVGHRTENKDSAPSRAQRLARNNDVFYQTVRPYQKNNYLFDLPYDNYVFSTGYAQMRPKNSGYFLLTLVQEKKFVNRVLERSTGTSYPAVNSNDLVKLSVKVPSDNEEQQRIGIFFKQLDETIALHQDKLNKLKQLKKGYLKVIFPQKREKAPKLRFARFSSDWEQRKLGDMLEERNEQIPENEEYPLMSFVQGVGVTPKGDRYDRSFLVKDNNKKYKKTELRDFIYSSNNLETGSIGFNKIGKAVISPVYSIFFSKNKLESQFIGILSTRKDFINKMVHFRQGVVYGQWRIHEKDFLSIEIVVPLFEEQRKIISFFKQLDEIIALHHDTVEQLKKVKEIYLQKLFI